MIHRCLLALQSLALELLVEAEHRSLVGAGVHVAGAAPAGGELAPVGDVGGLG